MTHLSAMPSSDGNISLCTGSGALDQAVEAVTGLPTILVGEKDPAASRLLAARLPHVPNLGDIKAVDWEALAASRPRPHGPDRRVSLPGHLQRRTSGRNRR